MTKADLNKQPDGIYICSILHFGTIYYVIKYGTELHCQFDHMDSSMGLSSRNKNFDNVYLIDYYNKQIEFERDIHDLLGFGETK